MKLTEDLGIEIRAKLVVDDKTFRTCLNLIDIYMQAHDTKGLVIASSEFGGEVGVTPLMTEDELSAAAMAKFHLPVKDVKDEEDDRVCPAADI